MAEFGAMLPPEEQTFLATELAECRTALESEDLQVVEDAVARLEIAAQRIGEAIYAAAESGGGGG
jgi:molecular chaperone DnaK